VKVISQGVCDVDRIIVGERFRLDNELDDEFLESIKNKGILQPITVDQEWTLVAGGRRLAAAKVLSIQIPYIQREVDGELDLRECELVENTFRKDFNWLDRNKLVARIHSLMKEKHGDNWNQRKTADLLNKSVGGINRHLSLNQAVGYFPELVKCKTEDEAVKAYRRLAERAITKDLVKKHEERIKGEASPLEQAANGEPEVEIPVGVRLAAHARSHYRLGNCIEEMRAMLEAGLRPNVSLVEIDPPYGIDLTEQKKGELNRGLGEYNEVDRTEYPDFLRTFLQLTYDLVPSNCRFIIWFGVEWYDTLCKILTDIGYNFDFIPALWAKPTGQTAAPDMYLARSYETFLVASKGAGIPIAKRGRSNIFSFNPEPHSQKYHPTQRPQELMEEILLTFGWPGSVVMVPFLGSGATLRAAYKCGMMGFGWDLSEVYQEGFLGAVETDIVEGRYNTVRMADEKA
jgi:ParB/RepB/Spo0J family partition protein